MCVVGGGMGDGWYVHSLVLGRSLGGEIFFGVCLVDSSKISEWCKLLLSIGSIRRWHMMQV